ncbi:metallophosphoesterase family protein [Undibacterium sp. TJN19]|uniref:metallophosphoesterase family protein n=1 Tax=Undibacterium sp. TJN19 TaxID=3413055 RepID=UPI003BF43840
MRLLAISDLHVRHAENRAALLQLPDHHDDWLILAGDICDTGAELDFVLQIITPKFARVFWVPGNHELWTVSENEKRGEEKYFSLVNICRKYHVLTPEDPFAIWPGPGGAHVLALMFLLYDYSFRPASVSMEKAVSWAEESGVVCMDEFYLDPYPYPSRQAWCAARCDLTERKLADAARTAPLVMVNHFPTRRDVAAVPLYPRFTLWCGTTKSEDWHRRFNARVVVSGHLHIPSTRWIDGVRFEEVSFGYPNQRRRRPGGVEQYLREILPGQIRERNDPVSQAC